MEFNFNVNKKDALKYALTYDLDKFKKFRLVRRKDNRYFGFATYDGKNYDDMYEYLQNGNYDIPITPEFKMRRGRMYCINGKGLCVPAERHFLPAIVAANSYLLKGESCYNLLFNYDVALYLLSNYEGLSLYISSELNNPKVKCRCFSSVEELEAIPEYSYYRKYNVWYLKTKLEDFSIDTLPEEVLASYLAAEDYYQEFEIFTKDGKVGILAYKEDVLVDPRYKQIKIENYRAYLQNEQGLWAEFGLVKRNFRSDFIYSDIQIVDSGTVKAHDGDHEFILHTSYVKSSAEIVKGENGFYGVVSRNECIVPQEFDWISLWKDSDNYLVFKDGMYGLYRNDGKVLLSCQYDEILADSSKMELFKVCKNDHWGGVGFHDRVYIDCNYTYEELEEKFQDAVDEYINIHFKKHQLLSTIILSKNKETGIILMKIPACERVFRIKKYDLPEEVYNKVMNSYVAAVQTLHYCAVKVVASHKLSFSYQLGKEWIHYKKMLNQLVPGTTYEATVHSINDSKMVIRLKDGIFGTVIQGNLNERYQIDDTVQVAFVERKNDYCIFRMDTPQT